MEWSQVFTENGLSSTDTNPDILPSCLCIEIESKVKILED
jgi:hypothetical protein